MGKEFFPDKTPISNWFFDIPQTKLENLGKQYLITDFGIVDDGKVYTDKFQSLIDTVSENGGGVIVVPEGTYITGVLYLKSRVNLYISENGILKGSDDISDYPVCTTRIEGETCTYFPALINADNAHDIKICGKGTIDGNGFKSWKAFWIRRSWNPNCTNKDEQRPRLIYISNSSNVVLSGLKLQNSHFWTNHFYKCKYIKVIDCYIYSPVTPVGAPSTDAIDIDACTDMLIKGCYFHVNDDAIALKGGKGPYADENADNGENERILIEDCEYGFCHSCLTCGSESIHNRNVLLRNIKVESAHHLLWLKMRPDTPQHYEYITIENATGRVNEFMNINPWKQFFDLKGRKDIPLSFADNITIKNCDIECNTYLNVKADETQYRLSEFILENLIINTEDDNYPEAVIDNLSVINVAINKIN
ncbi:MAG: exopolygalacturonase [Clostridia bacterium]|nr:exopolygalacturonase [Clostridia bacterium]